MLLSARVINGNHLKTKKTIYIEKIPSTKAQKKPFKFSPNFPIFSIQKNLIQSIIRTLKKKRSESIQLLSFDAVTNRLQAKQIFVIVFVENYKFSGRNIYGRKRYFFFGGNV